MHHTMAVFSIARAAGARGLPILTAATCLWLAASSNASAQTVPRPDPAVVGPTQAQVPEPQDIFDVWKRIRGMGSATTPSDPWDYRKPMVTLLPTFGSKPSTGVTLGVGSNVAVYFGDPATTQISSAVAGVSVSLKGQTNVTARFIGNAPNNQIRAEGDNRFLWTAQDVVGLGTSSTDTASVNSRFTQTRVFETVLFQVRPKLFAGLGLHFGSHSKVRPGGEDDPRWDASPYVQYSERHGFPLASQQSAGIGFNLLLDTRDNPINASRGWLVSGSYRPYFKGFLSGDSSWQQAIVDMRTFVSVTRDRRQRVAVWAYGDFVATGVAPYFDLPSLGSDTYGRTGRGYYEGRFRGERLAYGEVEYRASVTRNDLLGVVAFANVTTASNKFTGEHLFEAVAPAAGVGLRVMFNRRSKTNLCIDYGWGQNGSKGFYMALQEAF